MKRFLILFILISFVTVSCAGSSKWRWKWTKPDFRQEDRLVRSLFEQDRKECVDSIDKNLNSEAFGKALEECLENKGYEYKVSQDKEPPSVGMKEVLGAAIGIVLISVVVVLWPIMLLSEQTNSNPIIL